MATRLATTSKTRLAGFVRGLQWKAVRDALAGNPALLRHRDDRGRNWLHLCCSVNPKRKGLRPADAVHTAGVLLDAGLDLDGEAFREGSWKATPLWYAIARGENLPLARALLSRGADPNHCLWAAAFRSDLEAIALLAAHGAEIDPVTEDETPFLGAVKNSRFDSAEALLELGANPDHQDGRGRTALHYMLRKNSDERHFRMLLRFGARGDLADRDGIRAADVMSRKRSPGFKQMAQQLAG